MAFASVIGIYSEFIQVSPVFEPNLAIFKKSNYRGCFDNCFDLLEDLQTVNLYNNLPITRFEKAGVSQSFKAHFLNSTLIAGSGFPAFVCCSLRL